ncbi:hypothetical protein [Anabaena catenula]|uniref:Uncharacterized protein n=1 Tax=Anabaena catenula FACHB-362 TaxID=2692877 RepID=A0ABR8J3M8_9NOST|nr:hypothetical protein [Anabaena catenula]MBD2692755.1 hypothetical protein [Anabaena catenula FACHB-362]
MTINTLSNKNTFSTRIAMIYSNLRQYPSYTTIYSPAWETRRRGDGETRRRGDGGTRGRGENEE